MLGWQKRLGSIAGGYRADVIVVDGTTSDPYRQLIDATEKDVSLVVINGVPRAGTTALMGSLGVTGEKVRVGRQTRIVNLTQDLLDPAVADLSIAEATALLTAGLSQLGSGAPTPATRRAGDRLVVEGLIDTGTSNRPSLRFEGHHTGPRKLPLTQVQVAPTQLLPIRLDGLTSADPAFLHTLASEGNLPAALRTGLAAAYH
jgi:hypothetical protein